MAKFKRIAGEDRRSAGEDRRSARRVRAAEVIPQAVTRLATGQEVKLINIGVNGTILIHSNIVLAPGSAIRLRLKIPSALMTLEGRIQRCRVIGLRQEKVKYEAAIVLDEGFPQPLAERLQLLDEEDAQTETPASRGAEYAPEPIPETAELWVVEDQRA